MKHLLKFSLLCIISFYSLLAIGQQYALIESDTQSLSNKVCVTCHGAYGQGNSVVGAPSLAGLEPWYLRNQLLGFRANYRGRQPGYIPGYEMQDSVAELDDQEIDDLIASIASWTPAESAATMAGDVNQGAQLYESCAACHGIAAGGNAALNAPALANRDDWYMVRQLKLFRSGYRGGHPDDVPGAQMRAAVSVLKSEQDMLDVTAYIKSIN